MAPQVPSAAIDAGALAAELQPRSGEPLHQQLEGALRQLIHSGRVPHGAVMPGELGLATQLRVSRHTIRHALGVLTSEGLLRRERGRGTTVVAGGVPRVIERTLSRFYAFAWEMRERGADQRSFILERTPIEADAGLAEHLAIAPGVAVERIVRLRTADAEPLVLETTYLPYELSAVLDAHDLEHEAIYDALERRHSLRIVRARESIRPVVLSRSVARVLGTKAGDAAFSVERTTWSERGPIEWQQSLVRGDRYLYSVDLPRTG
jgi:GntR family transcriptional regulator